MALSEIEKLERRYAENPQGLTFAPLAEVHRKNGEVQRALDLLGPGLQIHPDYIPASIVLGRCHMDLGDVLKAETAFLHVLALDGENVIALKALADISERLLKFDDAERWLHKLLTVDRSNDEAREQLQRVEIARRQAEVASSAEPSSLVGDRRGERRRPTRGGTLLRHRFGAQIAAVLRALRSSRRSPSPRWVGCLTLPTRSPRRTWRMEDLEPSALRDQVEEPDPVEPLDGLVGREVDTPDLGADEFRVETAEDIILAECRRQRIPDAGRLPGALHPWLAGNSAPFEEDVPVAPSRELDMVEPAASAEAANPPAPAESYARTESPPEPAAAPQELEPVAEPVLSVSEPVPQAESLVYVPPETPAVTEGPPFQRRETELPPSAAPPKRSYGVGETGGRSVVQLFKGILSARPPMQASAAWCARPRRLPAPALRPVPPPIRSR